MPNTGLKKHGKDGAIFVDGTQVAAKAEWTLSLARDTVDVTSFGDTNRTYVVGLMDISGTYAGFLDNSGDTMLSAAGEDTKFIELYSDEPNSILVASGSGFIDATINCSNTDAVRINGNFRASGDWTVL